MFIKKCWGAWRVCFEKPVRQALRSGYHRMQLWNFNWSSWFFLRLKWIYNLCWCSLRDIYMTKLRHMIEYIIIVYITCSYCHPVFWHNSEAGSPNDIKFIRYEYVSGLWFIENMTIKIFHSTHNIPKGRLTNKRLMPELRFGQKESI